MMGTPVVIGPEMPVDPKDMDPVQFVAWLVDRVRAVLGPPPNAPEYPGINTGGGVHVIPPGPNGIGGVVSDPIVPVGEPNAAQISSDYQAALAAYNERWKLVYAELKNSIKRS